MIKTTWKPNEEISFMLEGKNRIGIISCGICANLSGTGGEDGINTLKENLTKMNKDISFSAVSVACCQEDLMFETMAINKKKIDNSDVLAILSCASGVKVAMMKNPGIPVMPMLNTVGAIPVTHNPDPVAQSLCVSCGPCVIGYTSGICPVSECSLHLKYGPCDKVLDNGNCYIGKNNKCVWRLIEERGGNLKKLQELKVIHKRKGAKPVEDAELENLMLNYRRKKIVSVIRGGVSWIAAKFRIIVKFLTIFR